MLRRALAPVLVVVALLLCSSVLQADFMFDARRDFYAGDWPRDVAVGDFNNDGHLDMAVPLNEDEEVGIFLGNGDGTFQAVVTYVTGDDLDSFPFSAAVGDLNGDDNDDVVVANWGEHTIGTLLANGDGTFGAADVELIGGAPNCVILPDLNEDTVLDVVTANWGAGDITIGLGNGDGTFTPAAVPQYTVGDGPYAVAAGDFNEDDDLDLIVANFWDDDMSILLGNGDGSFLPAVDFVAGDAPHDIAVADFNGDDHQDLAVPCRDADLMWIFYGDGDGLFPTHSTHPVGEAPYSVVAGDFDGDDNPDFAACCRYDHNVHVCLGDGAGGFSASQTYGVSDEPYSMALGDFDEDSIPDIAVACREGEDVAILYGRGDGTFRTTPNYDSGLTPGPIAVGDFDGDDHLDMAVANYGTEDVGILLGAGDGTFAYNGGNGAGDFPTGVVAGRFDADQDLDLAAVACNDRWMTVLLGDGDGTFTPGTGFDVSNPNGLAAGDLDGRGGTDLILANGTYREVSIYLCDGDGTFTSAGACTTGGQKWWSAYRPAVGDFNEDTVPDLAVPIGRYNIGRLSILLGNGDGTFEFDNIYDSGGYGGGLADVGYFNDDAHLDVAMSNANTHNISIFLGNGDGTLQVAIVESIGVQPADIRARDFDGDGELDIIAACSGDGGGASVILGNGDGTFGEPDAYACQEGSFALCVGDFNEDSRMDAAVSNNWSDNVSVLINLAPDTPVEHSFYASATEDGSVMVRWLLSSFNDARAVRLYRSTSPDGPFELLCEQALPEAACGEYQDSTIWPSATFWYDLRAVAWDGSEEHFIQFMPSVTVGGSLMLAMRVPTPNPFTSSCSFSIDIPGHSGSVRLGVYNVRGQLVRTLIDGPLAAGRHPAAWDGRDAAGRRAASGVYFMRLETGGAHVEEKAILLR